MLQYLDSVFTLFLLSPAQKQKHGAKIRHHFPIQQSLCWTLWSLPSNQERVTLATKLLTHSISSPFFHQCSVITECQPRENSAFGGLELLPHLEMEAQRDFHAELHSIWIQWGWFRQRSKIPPFSASSWFSIHNWRENKWPAHNSVSQEA